MNEYRPGTSPCASTAIARPTLCFRLAPVVPQRFLSPFVDTDVPPTVRSHAHVGYVWTALKGSKKIQEYIKHKKKKNSALWIS